MAMALFKISNNTTGYKDVNIFRNKFYCHQQQIFDIGTDATANYESLVKIDSLPIPANVKEGQKMILKSVKINYHVLISLTKNAKVIIFPVDNNLIPDFNAFMFCAVTSKNINSYYALGVGSENYRLNTHEKVLLLFPDQIIKNQNTTIYPNLEMIKADKKSYLNIFTNFGFTASTDYTETVDLLLEYAKLNIDGALTAGVFSNFIIESTYEFEVCKIKDDNKIKIKKRIL